MIENNVEIKKDEYKKLHSKVEEFEIKSRMDTAGEMFDLYFVKNKIASFQQPGLKHLLSCIFNLRDELTEDNDKK